MERREARTGMRDNYYHWLGIDGEPELIIPPELVVDHTAPEDIQLEE